MGAAAIQISATTYDALYRFDKNEDGVLTSQEVQRTFASPAVFSRFAQEVATLTPGDRTTLTKLRNGVIPSAVLNFEGQRIGRMAGGITWLAAEERIARALAGTQATMATMGQSRVGAATNMDCGQMAGLYMHYRRTGQRPGTHADVDALVAAQTRGPASGTTPPQLADILNRNYAVDGYSFHRQLVSDRTQLQPALQRALAADPGGTLVQIYDRFQKGEAGSVHWIVATALDGAGNVSYYDPKVADGGPHEYSMTIGELADSIVYRTDGGFSLVHGTH